MTTANACVGSVGSSAHANRRADGSQGRRLEPPGVARSLRCSSQPVRLASTPTRRAGGQRPSRLGLVLPRGFASPATPSARGERGSAPSIPGWREYATGRRRNLRARASREALADSGRFRASFSCDGSIGRIRWPRRRVRARGGSAHEPTRSLHAAIRARLAMPC